MLHLAGKVRGATIRALDGDIGTLDDIYFELRPGSTNLGEVDYEGLVEGRPQAVPRNPDGAYQLFRIGDAVAARNTHAAIYDALRLVRTL